MLEWDNVPWSVHVETTCKDSLAQQESLRCRQQAQQRSGVVRNLVMVKGHRIKFLHEREKQ